ncbi:MAG: S-formylglutathione hydrolase [Oscillatoriales cyanobacterium SM2_1_8]|nr:S-formylglutathione hydrolase [Oscillatoriales cyanobacterium SM2_1_8]
MPASSSLERLSTSRCFGGTVAVYRHPSRECQCGMQFSIYLPPQAEHEPVPVLYYLSGLTCTEENFTAKAGAQRYAAEYGLALVAPDTSPRGEGCPTTRMPGILGMGAGFYVDATISPWDRHYRTYSYVVKELPELVAAHFPIRGDRAGICGHSMGGHGALVCGLRHRDRYRSISALAPIAAPMQCPWGEKAFSGYLGGDRTAWRAYDATELVATHADPNRTILIDVGTADPFLAQGQLLPEVFAAACQAAGQPLTLRRQLGYDHSYYFVATFLGDHIRHHAAVLQLDRGQWL